MAIKLHTDELGAKLVSTAAVAVLGAAVGWGANALTLAGRVEAIEHGMERLEAQMSRLLSQRGATAPAEPRGQPIACRG